MNVEPAPNPAVETALHNASLSESLEQVRLHAAGGSLSIGAAVDVLRERGIAMFMTVMTLPFLIPVPTMGLSAPIGAMLGLFGFFVMLRRKPWLPQWIKRREMSPQFVDRLCDFGGKWARRFEHFLKPRLRFMTWPGADIFIGLSLMNLAVFLSLPLPIPFTNAIPAVGIILLLMGLIERDGLFVVAGHCISLILLFVMLTVAYLIVLYGFVETWAIVQTWLGQGATTQPASATLPAGG